MTLQELYTAIQTCVDTADTIDPCVEIWHHEQRYVIQKIEQYHVVPDVIITIATEEEIENAETPSSKGDKDDSSISGHDNPGFTPK